MSKLNELIMEYCPDGVEYKPLYSITSWDKKFNGVEKTKQSQVMKYNVLLAKDLFALEQPEGNVFLLSTGEQVGWTTEDLAGNNICEGEVVTIPWGKSRKVVDCIKYYKGKFVTGDNRIATSSDTSVLNNKYLYYCMMSNGDTIDSFYRGAGIQHPDMASVLDMEIPVPPLPVQEEIVRILDKYSELEEELEVSLEAEFDMRKKQYEYYRDKMLSLEGYEGEVEYKTLDDIATNWFRGSGIKRDEVTEDGQSCIRYGEIYTTYGLHFDSCISHTSVDVMPNPKVAKPGAILFAITGESVEDIAMSTAYLGDKDIYVGGDILVMEHEQDAKYLAYALSTTDARKQKSKGRIKSKVVHSNKNDISQIVIPIPKDINEQKRIADVLDRFYNLINDISEGLPAEIKMRHQQYEYYRDKLLNFKRLEVAANA